MKRAVIITLLSLLPGTAALSKEPGKEKGEAHEKRAPVELPKAVKDAIAARYPGATVTEAEAEHGGYEATVKTADGKEMELKLKADGTVLSEHEDEEDKD
ncbi:hypothetical protein [Pyxidicoccus sp. MSG2]|uniref:hypothetical protein n=1 Tax=Pyxidicoccus sp. MSG2 TaxID=2996790 RepID=UPI00226D72B5|nr:hypothetical protein [Pyxidicoccus sp. MSG2]MCY1015796.1 hypothetical protein [Pyxidicoccus sp. MSG2]